MYNRTLAAHVYLLVVFIGRHAPPGSFHWFYEASNTQHIYHDKNTEPQS